jgi:hypothetical protein
MARAGGLGLLAGMSISAMMLSCQKKVSKLLTKANFADGAIKKAIDLVEHYAEKIEDRLDFFKSTAWGKKFIKEDTVSPTVTVESTAKAQGTSAEINAAVSMGIFEAGDKAKLIVASATSYAAADGENADTYVNTFSSVSGVDTASIHTYHHKGENFEKAVETLVAIDWESIYDKGWVFTKHHSFYSKARKDVADGYGTAKIKVSVDQYVEADSTVDLDSSIKVLAFEDTIEAVASGSVTAN